MIIAQQSTEMSIASYLTDPSTGGSQLMEIICERENMRRALQRVRSNKGAPGVDGMTVDQLPGYLRRHWPKIKAALLGGTYKPLPVRRKEIEKPQGGVRLLGIPTALDRCIQQAVGQVLQHIWDLVFSESSFAFRPGRCQHDAIRRAKQYVEEGYIGYRHVVDMDLSKFFDRVNHDRLMSRLATKVHDKRLLMLIRKFLTSGVMIDGLVQAADEGTPQGGPLSPLLSNIVLDELDKELEKRNLCFARYADDFNIFVRSKRAANRVMRTVSHFVTHRLRLKVNEEKSHVTRPWEMCFLGFRITSMINFTRIQIHPKSIKRLKERVRQLTSRSSGKSIHQVIFTLNEFLCGWWNYYRFAKLSIKWLRSLHGWIMRRLRSILWKQWKNPRTRVRELKKRGIYHKSAVSTGNARKGSWRMSRVKWVIIALPNVYFRRTLGLFLPGIQLLF
jgi:RNA-directed DNA polymerase